MPIYSHPYTRALLSAVPSPDPHTHSSRRVLSGDVADPSNLPAGCAFHPRCDFAVDRCRAETPSSRTFGPGHMAACHRAEELAEDGEALPVR